MSFSDWSNNKKNNNNKKKKKASSFSEWSNEKYGITEEEKSSSLSWRDDEIAPVRNTSGGSFGKNKTESLTSASISTSDYDWDSIYSEAERLYTNVTKTKSSLHTKKGKAYTQQSQKSKAAQEELDKYLKGYGFSSIDEMRADKNNRTAQKEADKKSSELYNKYGGYLSASDFSAYSNASGSKIKDVGWKFWEDRGDDVYDFINDINGYRDYVGAAAIATGGGGDKYRNYTKYSFLTDEEKGIYNYIYAKEGKEKADEYLKDIDEYLTARHGEDIYENMSDVRKSLYWLPSGIENWGQGVKQFFSNEELSTTPTQHASALVKEEASDIAPILGNLYMAGETISNQIPNIILTQGASSIASGFGAGVSAASKIGQAAGSTGMFLSSSGNAYGQALAEGKSVSEARTYGTIVGALETGLQNAIGGISGLGGVSESQLMTKVALIEKPALRLATKYAVQYGAELTEEEAQLWLEPLVRTVVFGEEYDAPEIEEMVETAFVTAISTGTLNAASNISEGATVDGLTASDAKVVNAEVEKIIKEKEQNGKKVTAKEKTQIQNEVIERMEKGDISIDTIEEVLGGDAYKTYKDTVASEDALKTELNELRQMERGKMNDIQSERLAELKAMNLEDTTKRDSLRKQLDDTLSPLLKNSKVTESYNQRAKRGQAFTADLSQYKGKQREAVERAINSGVLNNTYRSHELVNILSKIEADKGIVFDYTNNAKLKESGFAIDGKTVNGFVKDGGVTLNVQSSKAWQSTVGHEITHVLESTEAYGELQQAVFAYAESKGELASKKAALTELYKDMDADIDAELTADLVGDYLFTDKAFVDHLTGNRTLFQKIYDEIKYLCKVATGKELTEIEKVKREFDRAWKEYGNKTEQDAESNELGDTDVKYSIREEAPPKETGIAYKVFYVKDGKLYPPMVANPDGADTPMGVWLNADVGTAAPPSKTGRAQVKAGGKGTQGGSGSLAFRPGWHLGDLPRASQFDRVNPETGKKELFPENFVWAEVEYAKDVDYQEEAMSYGYTENGKFRHAYAGLPRLPENGYYRYRTNPKPDTVPWVITGAMKVNRLLSDAEVNEILEKNGVPAVHRKGGDVGLDKFGFDESGKVKPTTDTDTRFSLSEAAEETKDLVALHNLTADKLTKSLELGGLPMPSLAITKSDIPHDNFGEITLIFDKKTIDPKANKKNKVYSADAWTPIFPNVDYEADSKVVNRASQKLRELEGMVDDEFVRDLSRIGYSIEDYLNRMGGEEGLIQHVMDNYGLKAAYLEDNGKHIEKVTKQEEVPRNFNPASADKYEKIMDILGINTVEDVYDINLKEARDNYGAELEAVFPGITKSALRMGKVIGMVGSYIQGKDSATEYRTVTDSAATRAAVDNAIDAEGFEAWVRNLFSGVVKDSGIYNNKDLFTPSGKRRSFKQTHLPVTLENIVKAMASQNDGNAKNVSSFNGVKTLRASTAETFKNIDEMHKRKDRLQHLTQEEADAITEGLQNRLLEVMTAIDNENSQRGDRNQYIRLDQIGETLSEIGETGKYGIADIQNTFSQYGRTISDDTAQEIKQLLYDVSQMPVNIFEAKPQRVVGFDEARVFVIPNNTDAKLKQELLNRGYSIAEYDPNVEGDRNRVVNQFEEYKFSLSNVGEESTPTGNFSTPMKEVALEQDAAPVADTNVGSNDVAEDIAPATAEEVEALNKASFDAITDEDAPPEMDAPYYGDTESVTTDDPFYDRDMKEVGSRKVKAYMYENPEVKPYFQAEAEVMLGDLYGSQKGERLINQRMLYETNGEAGAVGIKRHTTPEIAELLDDWGYTYAEIEKGLKAIIEDNGKENNACSKRIEFMLHDHLMNGYQDFVTGYEIPANNEYVNLIKEKQITEYNEEAFNSYMASVGKNIDNIAPVADAEAPMLDKIPVLPDEELDQGSYAAIKPKPTKQPSVKRVESTDTAKKVAQVLTEEPEAKKPKRSILSKAVSSFIDKGAAIENLSLKTKNRALQDKYKSIGRSDTKAQYFMENGTEGVKSLNDIRAEVEKTGKLKDFYTYVYHKHNIDRMSLESKEQPNLKRLEGEMKNLKLLHLQENQLRAIASEKITKETAPKRANLIKTVKEYLASKDVKNKPVFDYSVTSEMSRDIVNKYEAQNPDFKEYAQDIYDYMSHLKNMMVENGIISVETAKLWEQMYPYFVPIRRADHEGLSINVPLDTNKTGINAPIKRATGGNSDILPLFDTMAQRTLQTFKAIDKNRFGVELKNTLGGVTESTETNLDEIIDSIDTHEDLLQEGKNGKNPTFTVFEDGERVTFEITEDIYDALKPTSEALSYTNKALNTASNLHRGVLTEYSVPFMASNAIKDAQDVLINSQHPIKTYAEFPRAISDLLTKGKWYTEYMRNGGGDNTYFDKQTNTFTKEKSALRKIVGFPLDKISDANNFIEKVPRLAEYIASRENGASVDAAMLDAARVTTDFSAGGDVTKFLNRNGATFLNASVQGFAQQVRNVREAKANGLKGWLGLATKVTLAGLPAVLLNGLLWDDDEEYEELSDYVKDNYYIVGKTQNGKFIRIPKGRTTAVIQDAFEQIINTATGNDEADWSNFFQLAISNLAPNNPLDNNIIAPIKQVAENKTWYGEDLVPSRLQDLPAAEQFDESTDAISKWLGEKTNTSPYKINYLLNQYSGGVGDIFMPMLTPEAESGDDSFGGNLIAPLKDKFTTDSVMNNQNVSDFYDTVDSLTKNAKSSYATDEDILKSKYMNSVNSELGDLYKQKREIQNSDLSDKEKYSQVRDIQNQINILAKNALNSYEDVVVEDGYATVGDKHYRMEDGTWTKISDKQLERQQQVTSQLGISPSEYWDKTEISYFPNVEGEYEYAYENPEKYALSKVVGGYDTYKKYSKELSDIHADKDETGKSINGSRKEKVLDYLNNMDADYYTKIILFKSEYPSDDTYNVEIIEHINGRSDITEDEKLAIYTELGFRVENGYVYWD